MATVTTIEWTDLSFNPIRARRKDGKNRVPGHFCQKISPGCLNCYSCGFQPRFYMPTFGGVNKSADDQGVEVYLDEALLTQLLQRRKPAKVFWCDMSDLFGEWVPIAWIDKCFAVMALTPHLTHQILTKRTARMAEYVNDPTLPGRIYRIVSDWLDAGEKGILGNAWDAAHHVAGWRTEGEPSEPEWILPLPNVWLGTSVEDQKHADARIPELLRCPAAVRFLSCEPLLGSIDLNFSEVEWPDYKSDEEPGEPLAHPSQEACEIDWVIVGGESGHGVRPCNVEWIRFIVQQCNDGAVPCFVKQLGKVPVIAPDVMDAWPRYPHFKHACMADGMIRIILNNKKGGDPAEWPEDLRVRQFPIPVPSRGPTPESQEA